MKSGASLSHIRGGRILNWLVSIGILQLPAVHVKITVHVLSLVGMAFLDVVFKS
jgi:hypothetical protein